MAARAMLSVSDSEIPTQFFQNLNHAAAHYYRLYCIDPSEHCAVAVWASDRNDVETDQQSDIISLVTTRSENLRRIPTVKTARTLRLCCLFNNSMEYSATWDV